MIVKWGTTDVSDALELLSPDSESQEFTSTHILSQRQPVFSKISHQAGSCSSESYYHLSKHSSFLALKLHIGGESFLPRRKCLRYLRYLDLSGSSIEALPEDISILYNLQMLDLSNCCFLDRLPTQMKYMISLRHLYTHGCPNLKSMPPELGKLTKLQTLTCFVAALSVPDCSDVAELQHLNLGGQLELCQVENVKEAEEKVANLGNKKDLRELTLRWTSVCDSKVLDNFVPHDRLQVMQIYSYGGECMGMLQNMVEIHLICCERLQFLFRCGSSFTFPKLKQLMLEGLLNFERWWEINESQGKQIIFPVLEKLFISYCGKLVALPEAQLLFIGKFGELIALREAQLLQEPCSGYYRLVHSSFPSLKVLKLKRLESFQRWDAAAEGEEILFPRLEKLSIKKCPKLTDLPEAPQLRILEVEDGKQEIFHCVDRYLSSLTKLILKLENTETTSEAECTSVVPVDSKGKWNQKSPLTVMELERCNLFFGAGALEPSDYFVHLEELKIDRCDVLVHWPEKVFQSLVSLRRLLITNCEYLTGCAETCLQPSTSERSEHLRVLEFLQLENCGSLVEMFNVPAPLKSMHISACRKLESIFGKQQCMSELAQGSCSEEIVCAAVSELPSSPMNPFCPRLEALALWKCGSLPAVLNLPPSLKSIVISRCSSIQVLSCQLDGLLEPQITTSINVSEPSAVAASKHSLPPCFQSLKIWWCPGMLGGILHLPMSLKELSIYSDSGLTSLESLLRDHPPLLEELVLTGCSTLASLPNEPEAYGSLKQLEIRGCPAIKNLPRCLQQQLGSINYKVLDARYEVMALKPKTWKEIPRLVRERRQAAREARELQQAMQE